jgi:L-fuconolactonase
MQLTPAPTTMPSATKILDSHHHLWSYSPTEYPWIPQGSPLQKDYLIPELETAAQTAGLSGTVAVQARQSLQETRWLLDLADSSPLIQAVVGWLPLASPTLEASLEQLATHPKLKGARHVLQDEPESFFDDPDFNRGLTLLPSHHLTYDLLIYQNQLPAAIRLVDRHPHLSFIIDHLAKPEIHRGRIEPAWLAGITELAKRENITGIKFSGLATECRDPEIHEPTLRNYFHETLRLFGPHRLMYGSDWPVSLLRQPDYLTWAEMAKRIASDLTENERAAFLSGNAARIYNL